MSIKPYFQPKTTYNAKPDELEVTTELNKLEVPLFTKEAPQKSTEPAKPTIKCN